MDGDITKGAYDGLVADEQAAIRAAELELAHLAQRWHAAPRLPSWPEAQRIVGTCSDVLQSADIAEQRKALALLVSRVVPHRVVRGQYTVDIEWTPLGNALREFDSGTLET